MGIVISQYKLYKDPYEPTGIMECHEGFEHHKVDGPTLELLTFRVGQYFELRHGCRSCLF